MSVALTPCDRADEACLLNLFQLYAYDFSELLRSVTDERGRFPAPTLEPYWVDPNRHAFFIRMDEQLAGFVLLQRGSRINGDPAVMDVAEFFVMRGLRRKGVGVKAACAAFTHFSGLWEVRVMDMNAAGVDFWTHAIGAFTSERYVRRRWLAANSTPWTVFEFSSH